jgi:hypothetical protein
LAGAAFVATTFGAFDEGLAEVLDPPFDAALGAALETAFFAFTFFGAGFDFFATTFFAFAATGFLFFVTGLAFFVFFAALAGDFLFLAIWDPPFDKRFAKLWVAW